MLFVVGNDEIFGCIVLQYQLLYLYVIVCMVLVVQCIQIVYIQILFQFLCNIGYVVGDFVGDEGFVVLGVFMIEQDVVVGKQFIGFVIVYGDLIGVKFCYCIGVVWMKWCGFGLWCFVYQFVKF